MTEKYTGYIKPKIEDDAAAMDIPTMHKCTSEQFHTYLRDIFWVDHHDVLRITFGEYPLATSPEQIDILINYLNEVKQKITQ